MKSMSEKLASKYNATEVPLYNHYNRDSQTRLEPPLYVTGAELVMSIIEAQKHLQRIQNCIRAMEELLDSEGEDEDVS